MKKLALIDVSHIFRSAWAASSDQNLSAAYDYTSRAIRRVRWSNKYDEVIVCFDAPPYRRATFFPEYKANREAPDVHMVQQLKRLVLETPKLGARVVRVEGYEADDCIATIVRHSEKLGWESVIYSADKDLFQLITDRTTMISTRTGELIGVEEVIGRRGVAPKDIVTQLALEGDTADNIPGVPGVGAKRAAALISKYGDLYSILSADVPGAIGAALKECESQVLQAATLVELMDDVPIVWGELFMDEPEERKAIEEEPRLESRERETQSPEVPSVSAAQPDSPGLVKAEVADDGVQLRPGLVLNASQFNLIRGMAKYFHESGMYRRKFDTEAAVFSIMELGLELGMPPQVALQNFELVEGRPAPSAHYLIARASQDANCVYLEMVAESDESVTYETKFRGSGRVMTFCYTWDDAKRAGLVGRRIWQSRPREMLRKTAGSQAARLWYPGACMGLYSQEELGFLSDEAAA